MPMQILTVLSLPSRMDEGKGVFRHLRQLMRLYDRGPKIERWMLNGLGAQTLRSVGPLTCGLSVVGQQLREMGERLRDYQVMVYVVSQVEIVRWV